MRNVEARTSVVLPDVKPLPSLIPGAHVYHANDGIGAPVGAVQGAAAPVPAPVDFGDDDDDDAFLVAFEERTLCNWGHAIMVRTLFAHLERGAAASVRRGAARKSYSFFWFFSARMRQCVD